MGVDGDAVGVRTAVFNEANRTKCDIQLMLDEELCRMSRNWSCWDSAYERWQNCMQDTFIPPLRQWIGR